MTEPPANRRRAENEVLFRQKNERVQQFVKERSAKRKQREPRIHFYCECSDENCLERIIMTPTKYQRLHNNRSQFLIKPGHSSPDIERIVRSEVDYAVVEKYMTPPETASSLNQT